MSGPGTDPAEIFRDEAIERLEAMDAALLAIDSGHAGAESVESVFLHAHTIKGAAAMLGLDGITPLAAAVEDVLASVREAGTCPPGIAVPLLHATSALRAQVTGARGEPTEDILAELSAARAVPEPRPGPMPGS